MLLRDRAEGELRSADRPVRPINSSDLETPERFFSLLRLMTRAQDEGEVVDAVILDGDLDALYELLRIQGRPPDPILVSLPDES
jgi:hypothetical protein